MRETHAEDNTKSVTRKASFLEQGNTEEKGQVWTFCQDWGWVGERENQEPKYVRTVHSSEKYLSFPVEKPVL